MKPDQLIKRRGKLGLLKVNTDWSGVKEWLTDKRGKEVQVSIIVEFVNSSVLNIVFTVFLLF